LSKAYELLGVKPGVSPRELKAAHRDLAKVWHPDRFLHDPRLQEKAQEKLKEINEAYELLSLGPKATPPRSAQTVYARHEPRVPRRRSSSLQWAMVPLLLCVIVFAITTKVLQQRSRALSQPEVEQVVNEPQEPASQAARDSHPRTSESSPKTSQADSVSEVASTEATSSQPTPAVATVTVLIDPASGLLAKQDCPVRSRMTYPSGSEPSGYCNLNHAPPPKDSKIKSIAKSVGRALD
jgi:cytoskeletal protein RodZ